MLENEAIGRYCPLMHFDTKGPYHCIAADCMLWVANRMYAPNEESSGHCGLVNQNTVDAGQKVV